jgi:hypothetical protein
MVKNYSKALLINVVRFLARKDAKTQRNFIEELNVLPSVKALAPIGVESPERSEDLQRIAGNSS